MQKAQAEVITTTIAFAKCPICKVENIVTLNECDIDKTHTCKHYCGHDYTDDDKFIMYFRDAKDIKLSNSQVPTTEVVGFLGGFTMTSLKS